MRRVPWLVVSCLLVASGCGFTANGNTEPTVDGAPAPAIATIGFAAATSTQDEASGTVQLAVTLSSPSESQITIPYAVVGGSAINGVDYIAVDGMLTFAPGTDQQTIAIAIKMDGVGEDDETIELQLGNPTGPAEVGIRNHTLTISGMLLPRVSFTLASSSAIETTGTISVNVSLDAATGCPIGCTVGYSISGTATSALGLFPDHKLVAGTVTFAPNINSQTIDLGITDDAYDEDDETVVVTLVTSKAVVIGAADRRTHTIQDNDLPPTVAFSTATTTQAEAVPTVTLTATLSLRSEKTITVPYALGTAATNGATEGTDFTLPALTTLTFVPGQTTQTIAIAVIDDLSDEFDELVVTNLESGTNVTLGTPATHTLTITDDDNPPTVEFSAATPSLTVLEGSANSTVSFELVVSVASGKPITVGLTFGGNATLNDDYTIGSTIPLPIPPGTTTAPVNIIVVGDQNTENNSGGSEDVDITTSSNGLSNATLGADNTRRLTITDDD